jgi:peptidoglycan/xylan/chitin deacetylase (PgdA/CDA1 family)
LTLPHPGRFDDRPAKPRPARSWPGGKRLAVYVALNLESYAFGEGLSEDIVPGSGQPDVLNWSWREYGNRVGAWNLQREFAAAGLPVSLLVNSAIYDRHAPLVAAFRNAGAAIVAHGRTNSESQAGLDAAAERALIEGARDAIAAHEGRPPTGWLGPWIAETRETPDLLAEAGFGYTLDWCMDDQPVALATRAGPLLSVPYPQELNDSNAIVARRHSAADFADMIVDQFDEMREQATDKPLCMGVALHAYVAGQPFRLRRLRAAFRHLAAARDDVWLADTDRIAAHWRAASSSERPRGRPVVPPPAGRSAGTALAPARRPAFRPRRSPRRATGPSPATRRP